ncbi:Hypothetical predicted protein, partial [Mytilus galloprovincialis]
MAMRHSRLLCFAGAYSSLVADDYFISYIWDNATPIIHDGFTYLFFFSAIMGYATTIIPRWFTYYASSALFAVFGLKMIKE